MLLGTLAVDAQCPQKIDYVRVLSGLETAEIMLVEANSIVGSAIYMTRIDPRKLRVGALVTENEGRQTVQDLVRSTGGAILGINANFFDKEGLPLGLLVRNGSLKHKVQIAGKLLNGILTVKHQEVKITGRPAQEKELAPIDDLDAAFQSGPLLVANGKAVPLGNLPDENNRRSIAALDKNGNLLLFITRARFPGMSLAETQNLMLCPAFQIDSAINFDGGSSSQLYIKKIGTMTEAVDIWGGELVPAALGVFDRR